MIPQIEERSGYTLGPDLPYAPLSVMALRLRTTAQRLGRILIKQQIPVHRMGFVLLVGTKDTQKLRTLLTKRSGRKTRVRRPL